MYLFTTTRHGVPAKELQRQLGVTYKTAWRMGHKLRELMADADVKGPLSGHVEIDETFVGGKFNARKGRGQKKKAVVMGMVERDGNMRALPIPNVRAATLETVVRKNVMRGSIVSTDEWNGYRYLGVEGEYRHGTVNHGKEEWVRGIHHTNTIEGLWSRLKASIRGTHVSVSRKHLGKYVDEFVYRRNMRKAQKAMFDRLFETL
jgi:transposase-like protein